MEGTDDDNDLYADLSFSRDVITVISVIALLHPGYGTSTFWN